jgi:adenosylcobyric acid synthase
VETVFLSEKTTRQVQGRVALADGPLGAALGTPVTAYEIHMGRTVPCAVDPSGPDSPDDSGRTGSPAFLLEGGRADGTAVSEGRVFGTYLHGMMDNAPLRRALIAWAAARKGRSPDDLPAPAGAFEPGYDRLADVLRRSLDVARLYEIAGLTR